MAARMLSAFGLLLLMLILLLAVWLWGYGGMEPVMRAAAEAQRAAQNAMAQGLRALKGGQPGAWWGLMGTCFAYGFFHAAGPGHGKLVLGGYGLGRAVTLWRMSALALASSLAQAGTAVLLVLSGALLFDWGRVEMTGAAERLLAPVSYGLMALLGLYLVQRGLRRALRMRTGVRGETGATATTGASVGADPAQHSHAADQHAPHSHTHAHGLGHSHDPHRLDPGDADPHAHDHNHHDHHPSSDASDAAFCASCGHRHGPTLEEAAALTSWREALAIILAIAARPCTGAIFLLLLTWRLDVLSAGVAGAFAMGLGTASVTLTVALLAAGLRGGLLARGLTVASSAAVARLAALLEVAAGGLVMILCLHLLMRSL